MENIFYEKYRRAVREREENRIRLISCWRGGNKIRRYQGELNLYAEDTRNYFLGGSKTK